LLVESNLQESFIPRDLHESQDLIQRAELLIGKNKGILPRRSIGILKTAIKQNNLEDLREYVPMIEKKYIRMKETFDKEQKDRIEIKQRDIAILLKHYTKKQLIKKLDSLKNESQKLKKKWDTIRHDERTQRKATISNRADAIAKQMLLIQDALESFEKNENPRPKDKSELNIQEI